MLLEVVVVRITCTLTARLEDMPRVIRSLSLGDEPMFSAPMLTNTPKTEFLEQQPFLQGVSFVVVVVLFIVLLSAFDVSEFFNAENLKETSTGIFGLLSPDPLEFKAEIPKIEAALPIEDDEIRLEDKTPSSLKIPEDALFQKVDDATNGVYFVKDKMNDATIAVFKPQDEEKGYSDSMSDSSSEDSSLSVRKGIQTGESIFKEVAAYHLDHGHLAGVPETRLETLKVSRESTPQLGSLQAFAKNIGCSEDFSPSKFTDDSVESVALLDLRLYNMDRHSGNLLVDEKHNLIAIDHGFTLPDFRDLGDAYFEWMHWPQVAKPLSSKGRELVSCIDIGKDMEKLLSLNVRPECAITYALTTSFLKEAVSSGLNLKQVAELVSREFIDADPSPFELAVKQVVQNIDANSLIKSVSLSGFSVELRDLLRQFSLVSRKLLIKS